MKNSELIGVFLGADYVFDNGQPDRRCVVGSVRLLDRSIVKIRGYANETELSDNVTYRFYGHNRSHPKYGPQFNFNSFVEEQPADEDSIIAYLETCRKPERGSITRRVALALFEAFGFAAIERLKADPIGAAAAVRLWDAAKASLAADYLTSQAGTQSCKLDLIKMLDGRGFPKQTMDRAIKKWGAASAKKIRNDPYLLIELPGIGFKGADKLYCDLAREECKTDEEYQLALAAIHRQGLCAAYAVSDESRQSGSTWLPVSFAKAAVLSNVSRIHATPDQAISWAIREGKLVVRDGFIAVARMAFHELEIAEFITGSRDGFEWPNCDEVCGYAPADKPLTDHQREAIGVALESSRVACLQGSPGVGKTFCVASIVKAVIARFGRDSIAVCAPTGKAGVKVAQSMLANGVDLPASTIHRLLGVEAETSDGWSFHFNDQNPLPFRFVIIDESSMIDVDLLASLLRACTSSTHVLFVGDTGQLAPVGHGRPFFDLQQVVPTGKLTEIRRNSGRIVQACAEIRDHNTITFSEKMILDCEEPENLILIQCKDEDQPQILEQLIAKIDAQHISPRNLSLIDDLQVVTGKNKGTPVSRKPLNKLLQQVLNPDGDSIQGNPFRINDKIVDLKNGTYEDSENNKESHFVANGELGKVKDIMPGRMIVAMTEPERQIQICHAPVQENESGIDDSENTAKGAVGNWDLGYVLSTHRSQGSQWKFVIVMADSKGAMVQSRQWLYTAISRAEIATFVIGQKQVVNAMLKRDGISGRKTFLVERIRHQRKAATMDYDALFAEV
jgi:exodeoxyribonuclease V alpha subunit